MKPLLLWIAVLLMLLSACMLIVGIGSPTLWIAGTTVGVALVVVGRGKRAPRRGGDSRYRWLSAAAHRGISPPHKGHGPGQGETNGTRLER
jgi:hypothetical protein